MQNDERRTLLIRWRKLAGLTQAEAATALGYRSDQSISNKEKGCANQPVSDRDVRLIHTHAQMNGINLNEGDTMQPEPLIATALPFTVSPDDPLMLVDEEGRPVARFASDCHTEQELKAMAALAGAAPDLAEIFVATYAGERPSAQAGHLKPSPFAPYPWFIAHGEHGLLVVCDADSQAVAVVGVHAKKEANMRLIVDAPHAFDLLRELVGAGPRDQKRAENIVRAESVLLLGRVFGWGLS